MIKGISISAILTIILLLSYIIFVITQFIKLYKEEKKYGR